MITHQNRLAPPVPLPPRHLRAAGKAHWEAVTTAVELEPHDLATLTLACEFLDEASAARRLIKRQGMIGKNRFGSDCAHPAVAIRVNAAAAFRLLNRELCLSDTPPESRPAPGRAYK